MREDRLGKRFGVCLNTASPAVSRGRLWTSAADTSPAHTVQDGRGCSRALPSTVPTRRDHAALPSPSRDSLASFWCLRPSFEDPRWRTSLPALKTTPPGSSAQALGPGCGRTRGSRAAAPPTPGPAAPAPNPVPALVLGRAVTTGLEAAKGGNRPRQGQLWTTLLRSLHESPGPGKVFVASLGLSWTCHQGSTGQTAPGGL